MLNCLNLKFIMEIFLIQEQDLYIIFDSCFYWWLILLLAFMLVIRVYSKGFPLLIMPINNMQCGIEIGTFSPADIYLIVNFEHVIAGWDSYI